MPNSLDRRTKESGDTPHLRLMFSIAGIRKSRQQFRSDLKGGGEQFGGESVGFTLLLQIARGDIVVQEQVT
jgi:hypothetical protein